MAQKLYNTKFAVAHMTMIVANDKISSSDMKFIIISWFVMMSPFINLQN
jgi:hypothetical protein